MGQNIATSRAEGIRDINQKNAQQAIQNAQYAFQALPTYLPGDPGSGVVTDPNVFAGRYAAGPSLPGTLLSSVGGAIQGTGSQITAGQYPSFPYYGGGGGGASGAIAQNQLYGNNPIYQMLNRYGNPGGNLTTSMNNYG